MASVTPHYVRAVYRKYQHTTLCASSFHHALRHSYPRRYYSFPLILSTSLVTRKLDRA